MNNADDEIDVPRMVKLCESVTAAFGNYTSDSGLAAKQLAAEVPAILDAYVKLEALKHFAVKEIRRLVAEDAKLHGDLAEAQKAHGADLDHTRQTIGEAVRQLRERPCETQETISRWAEATFGPAGSNARAIARANREMSELLEHVTADDCHPEAAEEVADIVIVLYRVATRLGVDLHERIDAKMARNRVRKWQLDGTGHGYHVKESTADGDARKPSTAAELLKAHNDLQAMFNGTYPVDAKTGAAVKGQPDSLSVTSRKRVGDGPEIPRADLDFYIDNKSISLRLDAKMIEYPLTEPAPAVDWQARALAAEARCQQYQDALAEESGKLLARAAHVVPAPRKLANSEIRRSSWLAKIEALKPGDACEFHYPARKQWIPGVVVKNGGSGYWIVRDEGVTEGRRGLDATGLYIEDIRLPGQEEAWR